MAEKECLAVKLGIYVGLRKTVYIANRPSGTTVAGLDKESSVQLTRLSSFLQPYQLELVKWPATRIRMLTDSSEGPDSDKFETREEERA